VCRPLAAVWRSGNVVGRFSEVTIRRARLVLGDRLRRTNHFSISPNHPGQLSLLPLVGREMTTSQSAVMLCGYGVKTGMVHFTCGETCGWQVKLCEMWFQIKYRPTADVQLQSRSCSVKQAWVCLWHWPDIFWCGIKAALLLLSVKTRRPASAGRTASAANFRRDLEAT